MESLLKKELGTATVKAFGSAGGGCISSGQSYLTDNGKVFVKVNGKKGARVMFEGEFASLAAIAATNTVRVPKPIKVLDSPDGGGAVFIMEHLDMQHLNTYQRQLGEQLARLHLHNASLEGTSDSSVSSQSASSSGGYVSEFGFHVTTCCGYIPQDNSWEKDWPTFFMRNKLKQQLDLAEKEYGDREAMKLWPELERKIPGMYKGLDIKPALLHGDLWGGNVAEQDDGPVLFDPASFYGHHEFELGIASMFGGFGSEFYTAYHNLLPKAPGFNTRQKLYQLFHYLNHWNHFGGGYKDSSISLMKQLTKS